MTQSGGQGAGIQLQVGLDLAYFRNQLPSLGAAATGYRLPIIVKFDPKSIKNELKALDKINATIRINDSQIDAARARLGTLNKSLATLRKATSVPIEIKVKYKEENAPVRGTGAVGQAVIGRTGGQEALANKSRAELQKLYRLFREANLRVGELSKSLGSASADELRAALVPAFSDSGEEAVNGLAIGLKDPSSKVSKAAARLAKATIQDTKKAFGIASPSRVFKEIGQDIVDGLEVGLEDFNQLKTKIVGEMRQLIAAVKREARVGGIAMGGLLSPIAKPSSSSARTTPGVSSPRDVVSRQDPGRSYTRMLNSLSLLTGDPKLYRGRMANLGANRLPSSLLGSAATQMNLEEIAPSFRQSRLEGTKTGVANVIDEAFFGRGTLPKASSALSGLSNALERLASSARAAVPSGILQSASGSPRFRAFGGVPSSQSMGIFPPAPQPTTYPPSGGFLEFSRRATAISAGLPGNIFGGRQPPNGPLGGPPRGGGGFPSDGMMGGRQGPATFIGAGSQMEKFKAALDVASASTQNFRASQLPLIGGIKSLAGEFGEATKQVLLYGTAYKGLAFLTSLPGQVLNATKSQQQFNNGLKVVTQETGTFGKELLFVDNVQRAFGLNLETTRTGFTRLYASMAPTGFDSGSIEKLFTGISAATASLQLTPDKAERVIYAFGQMASKGQIMSEELKGQLGDVLPGALALFAKAAGMSVKDFSEAMEDGVFVGDRFREVFAKVSDELMTRFGTGAAAAGKSLQGLINTVGGDFQRTLESFAPLANAAAQATLGPLSRILKEVSMAAQLAMGEQDRVRKQLEAAQSDVSALKIGGADAKEIKAAEQNVAALAAKYEVLNEAAKDPAIAQQVRNIEAFVVEVQKAATFTMNLAGVIGSTLSPLFTILGGNLTSVVGNLALLVLGFNAMKLAALLSAGILTTMNTVVAAGGSISTIAAAKNTILAGALRLVGVQATGAQIATIGFGTALKGLLISTGIGALVVLLGSLAASALSVGDAFSAAAAKTKQAMDEMRNAVSTGNVALAKSQLSTATQSRNDIEEQVKFLEEMKALGQKQGGSGNQVLRTSLARRMSLEAAGFDLKGKQEPDLNDLLRQVPSLRADALNLQQRGVVSVRQAQTQAERMGLNKPDATLPVTETVEDPKADAAAKKAEQDRLRIAAERQRMAMAAANFENSLAQLGFQEKLQLTDEEFAHRKNMLDTLHEYEISGMNDMQARQKKFEKDLEDVQMQRVDAVRKALQEVSEARLATQAAANVATAASVSGAPAAPVLPGPTGGGGAFDTGMRTGPSRSIGGSADYHQDIMFGSTVSMKERVQLMDQLAQGYEAMGRTIEFSNAAVANERYHSSMSYEAKSSLISRAQAAHASRAGGSGRPAMDYYAPLASQNRFGSSVVGQAMLAPAVLGASYAYGGGGRSGRTMTASRNGAMVYQQLHGSVDVPLQGGAPSRNATVNSMARRETTEAYDLEQAKAKEQMSITYAQLKIRNALDIAYQKTATIIKQNIDSIYPIEKIKLENKLAQQRHDLQMQSMPEELIDYEERRTAVVEEGALAQTVLENNIKTAKALIEETTAATANDEKAIFKKNEALTMLNKELSLYEEELAGMPAKQQEMNIKMLEGAIAAMKNADALKAQQETMDLIKGSVESASNSYKGFMKEVIMGGSAKDALKKFQEAITDQVLTITLDFAMKPAEKMFKEQLSAMFGVPTEERARQEALAIAQQQLAEARLIATATKQTAANTTPRPDTVVPPAPTVTPQPVVPFSQQTDATSVSAPGAYFSALPQTIDEQLTVAADATQQGLADINLAYKGSANFLGQAAQQAGAQSNNLGQSLGKAVGAIGGAAGAIMGIAAGIGQISQGGASGVLGGLGSIFMTLGGAIGGIGGMFGGGGTGLSSGFNAGSASAINTGSTGWSAAFNTPLRFANGGVVNGPTLGLVGEGKYNEAIVPLPDGRSIPVQMRGNQQSSRDLLATQRQQQASMPNISMSFQTSTINGVEYVSRDQLEQAMAATRRQAAADGASRGMNMTLDKLQQSPSTRSRLGIGGR
jgi:tape measure domain-containing protein